MTCEDNSCGTGGWTGPKPGDPNNDVTLSANAVYGGINIVWSYPTTNPHAVAYTILYRGTSSDVNLAVKQHELAGSIYFDRLDPAVATEYFYWIQIVSVNDTVGDRIGPASATARTMAIQTLESLTGLIDAGVLAQALKTEIGNITLQNGQISKEIQDRINANAALSAALAAVQSGVQDAMTFVQSEITQRQTADSALVSSINTLGTAVGQNASLIFEEKTLRTTKDAALASDITTLFAKAGQNAAAVQNEATARANADSALASNVLTVQSTLFGNQASGQIGLTTHVNAIDGKINEIGSLYTVKLTVNGLVGGYGVYNNGQTVEAGYDVDLFWVGRTNADKVKPFIIDQGIVYIDKARIRNADIDTLKIAGNSVVTGIYDSGGSAGVSAGGTTNLITRTLDLGDGSNSGVIVSATVSVNGASNATVGFRVLINGQVAGDQRASILGGFGYLFPVSGFAAASGSRYATVTLQAYNPTSLPGSNVPFTVTASTISIMGGKR